ncbi:MAG: hypothetical protein LBJ47_08375 [Tannerella sp.]|nr:hypothetical protein [Tannerella sp.]
MTEYIVIRQGGLYYNRSLFILTAGYSASLNNGLKGSLVCPEVDGIYSSDFNLSFPA